MNEKGSTMLLKKNNSMLIFAMILCCFGQIWSMQTVTYKLEELEALNKTINKLLEANEDDFKKKNELDTFFKAIDEQSEKLEIVLTNIDKSNEMKGDDKLKKIIQFLKHRKTQLDDRKKRKEGCYKKAMVFIANPETALNAFLDDIKQTNFQNMLTLYEQDLTKKIKLNATLNASDEDNLNNISDAFEILIQRYTYQNPIPPKHQDADEYKLLARFKQYVQEIDKYRNKHQRAKFESNLKKKVDEAKSPTIPTPSNVSVKSDVPPVPVTPKAIATTTTTTTTTTKSPANTSTNEVFLMINKAFETAKQTLSKAEQPINTKTRIVNNIVNIFNQKPIDTYASSIITTLEKNTENCKSLNSVEKLELVNDIKKTLTTDYTNYINKLLASNLKPTEITEKISLTEYIKKDNLDNLQKRLNQHLGETNSLEKILDEVKQAILEQAKSENEEEEEGDEAYNGKMIQNAQILTKLKQKGKNIKNFKTEKDLSNYLKELRDNSTIAKVKNSLLPAAEARLEEIKTELKTKGQEKLNLLKEDIEKKDKSLFDIYSEKIKKVKVAKGDYETYIANLEKLRNELLRTINDLQVQISKDGLAVDLDESLKVLFKINEKIVQAHITSYTLALKKPEPKIQNLETLYDKLTDTIKNQIAILSEDSDEAALKLIPNLIKLFNNLTVGLKTSYDNILKIDKVKNDIAKLNHYDQAIQTFANTVNQKNTEILELITELTTNFDSLKTTLDVIEGELKNEHNNLITELQKIIQALSTAIGGLSTANQAFQDQYLNELKNFYTNDIKTKIDEISTNIKSSDMQKNDVTSYSQAINGYIELLAKKVTEIVTKLNLDKKITQEVKDDISQVLTNFTKEKKEELNLLISQLVTKIHQLELVERQKEMERQNSILYKNVIPASKWVGKTAWNLATYYPATILNYVTFKTLEKTSLFNKFKDWSYWN